MFFGSFIIRCCLRPYDVTPGMIWSGSDLAAILPGVIDFFILEVPYYIHEGMICFCPFYPVFSCFIF